MKSFIIFASIAVATLCHAATSEKAGIAIPVERSVQDKESLADVWWSPETSSDIPQFQIVHVAPKIAGKLAYYHVFGAIGGVGPKDWKCTFNPGGSGGWNFSIVPQDGAGDFLSKENAAIRWEFTNFSGAIGDYATRINFEVLLRLRKWSPRSAYGVDPKSDEFNTLLNPVPLPKRYLVFHPHRIVEYRIPPGQRRVAFNDERTLTTTSGFVEIPGGDGMTQLDIRLPDPMKDVSAAIVRISIEKELESYSERRN